MRQMRRETPQEMHLMVKPETFEAILDELMEKGKHAEVPHELGQLLPEPAMRIGTYFANGEATIDVFIFPDNKAVVYESDPDSDTAYIITMSTSDLAKILADKLDIHILYTDLFVGIEEGKAVDLATGATCSAAYAKPLRMAVPVAGEEYYIARTCH